MARKWKFLAFKMKLKYISLSTATSQRIQCKNDINFYNSVHRSEKEPQSDQLFYVMEDHKQRNKCTTENRYLATKGLPPHW
jgi:hypothetical protein